jgi:imidazolonepropionase-like amidohydrolase
MRSAQIFLYILILNSVGTLAQRMSSPSGPRGKRIVIAASSVLDGEGHVLHDTHIVIEGSRIVAIDPKAKPVNYDLRGLTLLPGWIDAHVHITWSFGSDGKNAGQGGATQEAAYAAASNAWLTLMAGFTTIQSVGSPSDAPLRDAIAKGLLPGPRILTLSSRSWGEASRLGHRMKSAPSCGNRRKRVRTLSKSTPQVV